jgi:hypothetical protein
MLYLFICLLFKYFLNFLSKKKFGFIPIKFNYRQYPAKITSFKFKHLHNKLVISEKDIGVGIGNAEHSTGILL